MVGRLGAAKGTYLIRNRDDDKRTRNAVLPDHISCSANWGLTGSTSSIRDSRETCVLEYLESNDEVLDMLPKLNVVFQKAIRACHFGF